MNQSDQLANREKAACRVCQQDADFFFIKPILGRYQVRYFKCPGCGFVQTETPFWLEEAYTNLSFRRDVGMVDRSINAANTTVSLAFHLDISSDEPCLDWGAGTGLMVRRCRDFGMDFRYFDPYASNVFAVGFEEAVPSAKAGYALVTAFEVAEHFADPVRNFGQLLELEPRYLLFATLLYSGQEPDWWYFIDDGQHVAFYTRRSLERIGEQFGYRLISNNCDLHMFSRQHLPDRLLNRVRRTAPRLAARYRRQYGSRIEPDFARMNRLVSESHPQRSTSASPPSKI